MDQTQSICGVIARLSDKIIALIMYMREIFVLGEDISAHDQGRCEMCSLRLSQVKSAYRERDPDFTRDELEEISLVIEAAMQADSPPLTDEYREKLRVIYIWMQSHLERVCETVS